MSRKPAQSGKRGNLSQFGLLDFPDPALGDDDNLELSDDDIDLEAELAAISGADHKPKKQKQVLTKQSSTLDEMIAKSLNIPEDDDGDDVDSGDENDPDLLSELQALNKDDDIPSPPSRTSRPAPAIPGAESSTVTLLRERIENYTLAEANAKAKGESSRARRFARGLKTLNDLMKQAKAGKSISEEDIPPPVSMGQKAPVDANSGTDAPPPVPPRTTSTFQEPSAPAPYTSPHSAPEPSAPPPLSPPPLMPETDSVEPEKEKGLQIILKRKEEFKAAALSAKQTDKPLALEYMKVIKQFALVENAWRSGEAMDLSELPTVEQITEMHKQAAENTVPSDPVQETPAQEESGLVMASSVEEALKQRLAVFQEQESKAREQGNASKQRRMGRIVKQYLDAIKLHNAGKPIPVDELPTPPGFAPIPVASTAPPSSIPTPPQPSRAAPTIRPPSNKSAQETRADKQLAFLLMRQKEFKEAALKAKKNGNITQAKEYLRAAKGFDSVLDAARGGLAVDLKSLPLPPQEKQNLEKTFDIVSADDCIPPEPASNPITLEDEDVLSHLHQQLTSQLKLCLTNREHYRAMGNVAETNRFEHLAANVRQDLDVVTVAKRLNRNPPKFHYESKQFSVIQCNTDLNENDLELTIVRGIAYNVPNPKEVDTYVKFEFPFPQEAPVSDRTSLVKDSNSPEYNAVFPLAIQRGARPCLRVFKRHGIKFEVYSRGGWFTKDQLVGTVVVKLAPLESQVTLHEAFPLMDGRRPAGGSLEVKLRVRTPLLQQQFVNTTHRWLCIDS